MTLKYTKLITGYALLYDYIYEEGEMNETRCLENQDTCGVKELIKRADANISSSRVDYKYSAEAGVSIGIEAITKIHVEYKP